MMEQQNDILDLLKDKTALLKYILDMIASSDKFAQNLPELSSRGWSDKGRLDKVIEITAIQSRQIKHLALIAFLLVQSSDFDNMISKMLIKMGRSEEVLSTLFEAKLKQRT